jgi:iron complex transport system substrate-binding protein
VLWYPDSSAGQVLRSAGLRFSKAGAGKTGNYKELSFEKLDLIADADAIAVYADRLGEPRLKELTSQPTWKRLPAVRAGHVYAFNQLFPYSYGDASTLLHQFETALGRLR